MNIELGQFLLGGLVPECILYEIFYIYSFNSYLYNQ